MTDLILRWQAVAPPIASRWRSAPVPLVTRWRGPTLALAAIAAAASLPAVPGTAPLPPVATIIGPPGGDGGVTVIEALASVTMARGTPVAISRATGAFIPAIASLKSSAFVVGLITVDVTSQFIGRAATSELVLSDWTAITGAAALLPGQIYFLGAGGGLTTVPPGPPNCVARVGEAVDARTLLISPQPPIQL